MNKESIQAYPSKYTANIVSNMTGYIIQLCMIQQKKTMYNYCQFKIEYVGKPW